MSARSIAAQGAKLGLPTRFSILVCGLILIIGALTLALIAHAQNTHRAARAADAGRNAVLEHGSWLQGDLARGDHARIGVHPAFGAFRTPVIGLAAFDRDGRLIKRAGAATPAEFMNLRDGAIVSGAFAQSIRGDKAYAFGPVKQDGRVLGFVEVALDRKRLSDDTGGLFLQILLLLLAFLVAAIPLTILATRRMMAPLRDLTAFAERAASGDLSQRLDIATGDEFEALAEAYNGLLKRFDRSNQQIRKLAFTDQATGLHNRERLRRDLGQAAESRRAGVGAIVVLRFHRLQRLGEAAQQNIGESLLKITTRRLLESVRTVDRQIRLMEPGAQASQVARLDTADFAVHAPLFSNTADLRRFVHQLRVALSAPIDWQGHRVALDVAIGAAVLPPGGIDPDDVLRQAFVALSATTSLEPLKFYTRAMDRDAAASLNFESDLRSAIVAQEFHAYFQPKVCLLTGKVIGAEALARWLRPDGSMISPGRFIPVAERIGVIGPMSDLIMRDACWKAAAWRKRGLDAKVAVNVSPLQFGDDNFTSKVQRLLEQSGLEPFALELEITESVAMENPDRALALLAPLREQGVRISLDDFGCGHSSLAALTRLPIDAIKIDQQFVRALSKDPNAATIVETILAMAASLNHEVVAEGIETEQEAQFLRRRGCMIGQGFLYGAATPAEDFVGRVLPPEVSSEWRKSA